MPQVEELQLGGSHIANDSAFFLTGRAEQWLQARGRQAQSLMGEQQADGSFRYSGEFARGHWEDTASGVCVRPATTLLEYARITGEQAPLDAGLKALRYARRFNVPRGAQTWEIPLHTPDLLASAYAVLGNVRAFELTGEQSYLAEARRWALTGVPFVYQWTRHPVMLYGTPPVLGATNWRSPYWVGLPVQWVGLVYAYSLAMLAPHDDTLDWRTMAEGILVAAEQMQYTEGPYRGLLPDAFALVEQERRPWTISPCALASLRLVLDGQLDGLAAARTSGHCVASPFAIDVVGGDAVIAAPHGVRYQVLVDGKIREIESQGINRISLE